MAPVFTTTIYGHDGALKGVVCKGDCGAPCWMADAQAVAQGRRPTLGERLTSASDQLDNVEAALSHSGPSWTSDLAGDLADAAQDDNALLAHGGYTAVHDAVGGAAMLAVQVGAGQRATNETFDDYLNPIAGLLRGAAFYLELDYDHTSPAGRRWAATPAQRRALDRIRQLVVELGHQLDVAQDRTPAGAGRSNEATDVAAGAGVLHGWSA